jgi:hypothetical protein
MLTKMGMMMIMIIEYGVITVCVHLHYTICKKLGIEATEKWYSHTPKSVTEHEL